MMVPTHVSALKRALGCPALWSMRKLPPAKVASSMVLWPGLLALAVVLSLVELVLRKWKGVMKGVA